MPRLAIREDDQFIFDPEAADRPIRFVEKFCKHFEGRDLAGKAFLLHPEQKRIVRDIYGWKSRETGLRRFTDVYFEGAVGAGKSPLLAALGLYGLMADGEQGAQVYSLASTYSQARVVFDAAKKFALASTDLSARLNVIQYEIRHPRSNSFWAIVSGHGPGAGRKPTLGLADEVHDWTGAGGYHDLRDRMTKRLQPLMFAATNAGESRASFCWQLRERAEKALAGADDPHLYPIIWAAPEDASPDDPAAWAAANPLLGTTIQVAKVRQKFLEMSAGGDESFERFKRLYLGWWPKTGGGRWLDMNAWSRCEGTFNASGLPPGTSLYVGLDMALTDDLCAAVFVWVSPNRHVYIHQKFWLPESTAKLYDERDGIPYKSWAEHGHIELVPEPVISGAVRRRIAAEILRLNQAFPIKVVAYDRYKADETIAVIEAEAGEGIRCVPVGQGFGVARGCSELEGLLKQESCTITPNPVMRWCAGNSDAKGDEHGNVWPVKPNAKGSFAGTKALKIDGISALVTALTEARKDAFPEAAQEWKGDICLM